MTVSNVSSASSEKSLAARSFRVTWGSGGCAPDRYAASSASEREEKSVPR